MEYYINTSSSIGKSSVHKDFSDQKKVNKEKKLIKLPPPPLPTHPPGCARRDPMK